MNSLTVDKLREALALVSECEQIEREVNEIHSTVISVTNSISELATPEEKQQVKQLLIQNRAKLLQEKQGVLFHNYGVDYEPKVLKDIEVKV